MLRIIVPVFLLMLTFTACNQPAKTIDNKLETDSTDLGPEYTSDYICPMYCDGSGSESAGICPVCKMKYVVNPVNK